jgi:hypothetical protein
VSLRSFILWFMPDAMKKAAEADSRAWIGTCKHCGAGNSIWDIGGIRYKAAGEPITRVRCPKCGKFGFVTFRKCKT